MTNDKLPVSVQERIRQLHAEGLSTRKIAEKLYSDRVTARKIHSSTVSRYLKEDTGESFKSFFAAPSSEPLESDEISGDSRTISLPKTRIKTLEELIEHCEIDTSIWYIDRYICNKWEVGAKDAEGELQVSPLFQVKAFLKKKVHLVSARQELEELKAKAKEFAHEPPKVAKPEKPSKYALELAIVDHHFGKLGWGDETGFENYDIKIAEKIYWKAFDTLLKRAEQYTFDECVFCIGNDLFQSDNAEGTTTKGTQVSNDGRYQKVFTLVRDTMIKSIEELRKISKKVKVVMVSGNHDALSVWTLGSSLEMYFFRYKDVEIDNSPRMRKYHRYGNSLIMFTHGHTTKSSNLPILMATENPKEFGDTVFHEIHTGHKHTKQSDVVLLRDISENHGVRVRILSALCGIDDYHASNGFVGNQRSSEAFIWDKKDGLVATYIYTYREGSYK